jgi:ribosomal protein L14
VTGLSVGTYVFRLTVTDNSGATATDDVNVVVNSASNQQPSASAGLDQTITLPATLTLSGSGTDPDGTIASYSWTKVSGGTATITSPSASSTTVTGLAAGSYTFRLTVTDNGGATAFDEVNVTVNAAPANQPPTASAGADQSIILPVSSVTLSGSGTDPDGSIASYSWTKVLGTGGTITSPASASTTVTGLTQGSYTFRLTVTDNSGATGTDDVVITVNQQPTPTYSKKIEAESYTSTVGTVSTAATTDLGGTLQVGGLDNNDVLNYTVDVLYSGTYNVNFRVGATKGGSKLQLLSSSGTLLATINVPNTGTAWQTVSVPVNLTAGNAQTFKVVVNKSSGNPLFNWWEINLSSLSAASITSKEVVEVNYEVTEQSSWNIYPKPVHNQANIEINDLHTGIIKVQIWNMAGVLQKQFTRNKTAPQFHDVIFVDDLPKGEYILRLEINNVSRSMKFIKL